MDVQAIRRATGLSQDDFARAYRLNVGTLRQWELVPPRRSPSGAAATLLRMIEADPEGTAAIIAKAAPNE